MEGTGYCGTEIQHEIERKKEKYGVITRKKNPQKNGSRENNLELKILKNERCL
jgi:NAD dependent epimerase/dehydratase family enzyme